MPPAIITLVIDTTSPTAPWSLDVTDLTVVSTFGQYGEMYAQFNRLHSQRPIGANWIHQEPDWFWP